MKKLPAQHTYFLMILLINIIIAALLVFNIFERNQTYRDHQHLLAKKSVTGLSNAVNLYIQGLRRHVHLFTDQEQNIIQQLINHPDDKHSYNLLDDKISQLFPEHFSWTIASSDGVALLESFDHLVGKGCRRDIKKFVSDINSHQVYVHSSPQKNPYHFDIMVPIEENDGVFFLSFNLNNLTEMIKNAQLPGHHLLLMKQGDAGLIEVTSAGSFFSISAQDIIELWQKITGGNKFISKKDLILSEHEMQRLEFIMPVPETQWTLADLPDAFLYHSQKQRNWFEAIILFLAIAIISTLCILFLKKRQDQFLLLKKKQELKEFLNCTPIMMWMTRAQNQDFVYNDTWVKFSGIEQDGADVSFRHHSFIHADDLDRCSTIFSNSVNAQLPFTCEYRQLNKSKQYCWLRETAVPRFDEQNHYQGHTGICIDITEQKQSDEEDKILLNLLKYSFEPIDDFLKKSVQAVTSIPWLGLNDKGGIFLIDEDGQNPTLKMVCSHNLHPQLLELCAQVPFGQCLCGRAALSKKIQFASCVDHRHENRYEGMQTHGHYNVPLMHGEQLLGVMVLYLEHGHKERSHEVQFLQRVSHIIGLGISKHRAELQVRKHAYFDALTGLPNRYLLMDRLQQAYTETKRHGTQNALIFIDLDHFKNINDTLGHMVGDKVLIQVAHRLRRTLREEDTLARLGGDEFIILLKSIATSHEKTLTDINKTISKLNAVSKSAIRVDGQKIFMTMSMGIALIPNDGINIHEILSHADAAMYQAKKMGRNTFAFYSEALQIKSNQRRQLEADLWLAIDQNQFVLYYQPQVNQSKHIIGVEALIYWLHPRQGKIGPAIFIPIAEESGMILDIGKWVINMACEQFNSFCAADSVGLLQHIAVNISAKQFHHQDFFQHVKQAITQNGMQAQQLVLELTESIMIANVDETIIKMQQLKALGVDFSIDDFGTGYSSLNYLKRLPIDQLKIDKSFVDDIETDLNGRVIIETIISMSQHLNLDVIAEGVESSQQLKYLQQAGCHSFQGYLYSKPLVAEQLMVLLNKG